VDPANPHQSPRQCRQIHPARIGGPGDFPGFPGRPPGSGFLGRGYRVEFAADGQEALDAFTPEKFSAILMDMQMPVMDGLEATRRIRERESGTRVPIIALTANVMPGDRERCLGAGMDEFLTKPFKLRDLSGMLTRFLHC
jgi:CheY-like chemotaxis protein